MQFKILFINGRPLTENEIEAAITKFNHRFGYQATVREIINRLWVHFGRDSFLKNSAQLMTNFKMTRSGLFKGVKYQDGIYSDPNGLLKACWSKVGDELISLRAEIFKKWSNRTRVLVDVDDNALDDITTKLWEVFKKLLPICMSTHSWGLVGASKIVFSAVPEFSLPIDNSQWKTVFKTVDYKDIITFMALETKAWESAVGRKLDVCDPHKPTTLAAIYNVMAMKARNHF